MHVFNITFSLEVDVKILEVKELVIEKFLEELYDKGIVDNHQFMELVRTPHGEAENTFTCQVYISKEKDLINVEDIYKPRFDHQLFLQFGERCLSFSTVLRYL